MVISQILNPAWVTAVFTGVLTAATIFYVIYTRRLWHETMKSADAAMRASLAAKQSADAVVELNRPMVGIAEVALLGFPDVARNVSAVVPGVRQIVVTLKNYGATYAKHIDVEWTSFMQATNETRNRGNHGPLDIAQGASVPINLSVRFSNEDATRIAGGGDNYKIQIQAEYSTPDGKSRWRYNAVRVFRLPSTFTMDDQVPDRTEQIFLK